MRGPEDWALKGTTAGRTSCQWSTELSDCRQAEEDASESMLTRRESSITIPEI